MNPLFAPDDHPADGIHRCADVVAFCAEALEPDPGRGVTYTRQARDGLCLILGVVSDTLEKIESKLAAAGK